MFLNEFVDPISNILGNWSKDVTVWSILLRVLLCVIASAILGCERSSKRHAAGLRTYIIVSLSSTIAGIVDSCLTGINFPIFSAACLIGVAILSVNTVLFSSKSKIKGLTTSVGLWANTILGVTFGFGFYLLGIIFAVVLLLCILLFVPLEGYLKNKSNHFEVMLELKDSHDLQKFVTIIRKLGLIIDDIEVNTAYFNSGLSVYSVSITINSKELKEYKSHEEIIEALSSLDFIYHIEEMK